jgi:glycosyltransferase involved in cell wall biosynthesis
MKPSDPSWSSRRPTVSVVIPCYNYGHFLPDAVASALDQADLDVDVLVVDDASSDGSAEVALDLARRHERVDVLLHEENRGHIQTYNDGLAKVSGDYVVLLSADDLLPPNALTRAVAVMEAHPRVGLVYGFARSFEDSPPPPEPTARSWSVWPGRTWFGISARRGRCFLMSPEAVMRREALAETDGYDPRLPHSGDWDMWMRTAVNWDVARVNGATQAFYRVHATNMHVTTYAGWLTDLEERRKALEVIFDERAPDVPWVAELRPAATRALANEALRRGLAAHRDRADGPDLDAHRAFAERVDPTVRETLLWRWSASTLVVERRIPAAGARRAVGRVRDHVEWRRRRRFGT